MQTERFRPGRSLGDPLDGAPADAQLLAAYSHTVAVWGMGGGAAVGAIAGVLYIVVLYIVGFPVFSSTLNDFDLSLAFFEAVFALVIGAIAGFIAGGLSGFAAIAALGLSHRRVNRKRLRHIAALAAGVTAALLGAAVLGLLGSPILPAIALAPIAWWLCNAALNRSANKLNSVGDSLISAPLDGPGEF